MEKRHGRDMTLDLIKASAIFWVVFYHNAQLNPNSFLDNLLMLIPSAAVPLFFMVSGALFFHSPFDMKRHVRRIIKLYLMMVFWKLIFLLLYRPGYHWLETSREALSYLFLFGTIEGVPTGHFWFFQGMLTVLLAAPVLYACYQGTGSKDKTTAEDSGGVNGRQLICYALIVLVLFNQVVTAGNLLLKMAARLIGKGEWDITVFVEINPFSFRYSVYLAYYLLGAVLADCRGKWKCGIEALVSIVGLAGLLLIRFWQTGTWLWEGIRLEQIYYWISTMLLASGLFLLAYRLPVDKCRSLQWIAKYVGTATFSIYCMHILAIRYLTPVLFAPLERWNGSVLNALESLVIIACILVIHYVWNYVTTRRTRWQRQI